MVGIFLLVSIRRSGGPLARGLWGQADIAWKIVGMIGGEEPQTPPLPAYSAAAQPFVRQSAPFPSSSRDLKRPVRLREHGRRVQSASQGGHP